MDVARESQVVGRLDRVPPATYFVGSAVFHYLGPAFAVLLFALVPPLGVAWLRIAAAAAVFAAWRRPWRTLAALDAAGSRLVLGMGAVLAVMNVCFYVAIDRLPLGTVAAIEFLPVIGLAALGARTLRNGAALVLAVGGVYLLTNVQLEAEPVGLAFAFANAALFALYIVLAHRVAQHGAMAGIDGLAAAMLVAWVVVTPLARLGGAARVREPARAPRGNRRRHHLVGDPLRLRSAGHGANAAGDLCAARVAPARDGDGDRRRRPPPDPDAGGDRGRGARRRRRRRPPGPPEAAR